MKRKIAAALTVTLISSMLLSSMTVFANTGEPVKVSDVIVKTNGILQPINNIVNKDGSNLVPLRAVSEILGADDIYWDQHLRKVRIRKDNNELNLFVDTNKATYNNKDIDINVGIEIVDDTVMVPLRFISEIFDADVEWDENSKTISINTENTGKYILLNVADEVTDDTTVYSFDEAFSLAEKKNSSLKDISDSVRLLDESRDSVGKGLRLLDDSYATYQALADAVEGGGLNGMDSNTIYMQMDSSISQIVSSMQSIKNADINKSLVSVNEQLTKDSLEYTLKRYISAIKITYMSIELLEENIKLGEENIKNLELKYSLGMESEYNLNNAKQQQKQTEATLEQTKLSLESQKESLKSFLGVPSDQDVVIDYTIEFNQLDGIVLENYIADKIQNDPSIKQLKAQKELADYNARISEVLSEVERIQLQNAANTAGRNLTDAQDNMEKSIKTAYNELKKYEEKNKANLLAVEQAVDTYNSVVVSYQAGMATAYQVNQAKLAIMNAEIAVEQNAIEYDSYVFSFENPYLLSQS